MPSNATETIDARILRLIGLEDTFDLDYDTYLTLLKEAMVKGRMPKTTIPSEEVELLTNEWKRVKSKKDKGRFKVKKKKITATALKIGSIKGKTTGVKASKLLPAANGSDLETRVFNNERKITHLIKIVKLRKGNVDKQILDSVTSIADTLKQKKKLSDKEGEFDRKAEEEEKRKAAQGKLKERFKKVAQVAQKVIAPVQSILDKIINYFVMIFAGRVFVKLFEWFTNPDNKSKVDSIVRFLGDHWPKLLSLFLVFGTGLGRFIVRLAASLTAGAVKLLAAAAQLAASAGMKSGGKILGMRPGRWKSMSKFGNSRGGQLLSLALTVGGTALATHQMSKGIEGVGNQEPEQGFSGGGKVGRLPGFSGGGKVGGLGDIFGKLTKGGGMMGALRGAALNAALGPLGMILGSALNVKDAQDDGDSDKPEGYVSGEKGVDKVPARLTEGEFVMSTGAVEKYGLDTLESMNAAGGGTNIPKIMGSTTYAYGGGEVSKTSHSSKPVDSGSKTRERTNAVSTQLSKSKRDKSEKSSRSAGGFTAHRTIPNDPSCSWAAGIPLTRVRSKSGKTAEVALALATRFQGFIDDLEATGYKIKIMGGFRKDGPPPGNVDGKGPRFAHPYGAAIDINFPDNPAFTGKAENKWGDFPSNSGDLAAKYGLGWGGHFDDAMHFSAMRSEYGTGIGGQEIRGDVLRAATGEEAIDRSLESVDSPNGFTPSSSTNASTSSSASLSGGGNVVQTPTSKKTTDKPSKPGDGPVEGEIKRFTNKRGRVTWKKWKIDKDGKGSWWTQTGPHAEQAKKKYQEDNLSPELKAKIASQANLDKLSNEGKGKILGYISGANKEGELNETGGERSAVRSKGTRFDAEEAARSESIKKRGGWWGQLKRALTVDGGYMDNKGNWRDIKAEDKAATARVKQKGAESISKYYSSSDGEYYDNYNEAVKARDKRLAKLARDQKAAKTKIPPPPPTNARDEILAATAKVQAETNKSNDEVAELVQASTTSSSQPDTPSVPDPASQVATTGGAAKRSTVGMGGWFGGVT